MRGLLVLIVALVAPLEILSLTPRSRRKVDWERVQSKCSNFVKVPDFSESERCGYSFPALEEVLDSHKENWQKILTIAEIINIPWAFKIPAEAYDCYWKVFMDKHSQIIGAIVDYYSCLRQEEDAIKPPHQARSRKSSLAHHHHFQG